MKAHLNINELESSNFLASFLKSGGLIQTSPDQFILISGDKKPVFRANFEDSHQNFVYSPKFWEFLELKSSSNSEKISALFEPEHTLNIERNDLLKLVEKLIVKTKTPLELVNDHKAEFNEQFKWSQEKFKTKKLKKTVPVTKFEFTVKDQFNFLYHLYLAINKTRTGYIYGAWNESDGFIGLTPEVLASWCGKTLSTMALAGTWSHELCYKQVAEVDLKTQEEHQFAVQDICERLDQCMVSQTQVLNLPLLSHLKTEIQKICISKTEYLADIEKLHPTAALGIYPRDTNMALEFSKLPIQRERQFFGAPFGIIAAHFAHVVVGIRGLTWTKKRLNIYVGCGVTAQSNIEAEWQELITKKNSIIEAFSLQIL